MLDGNRLDALGTTLDVSSRGISGIVGPKDRARFQDRMTPPGSASIAATAKLDSAVKAELQRLNAEQVRAKAELEPQALLARIKFLGNHPFLYGKSSRVTGRSMALSFLLQGFILPTSWKCGGLG